jgi:ABC-type glutathione transport system ATPase component
LFTEHDMTVVFSIAQKIAVLHQGRMIAEGPNEEVRRDLSTIESPRRTYCLFKTGSERPWTSEWPRTMGFAFAQPILQVHCVESSEWV